MAKRTRKPKQRRAGKPRKPSQRVVETALAGIAHDLRTPLTGILALAELLASSGLGERERQWASALKSGAEHLAALTTLIVDAVKADVTGLTLRHDPFSPRQLAEAVGRALTARAETKGLKAEIVLAHELPAMVAGDELRLRAAVENLADNAVKFTEEGSVSLEVSADNVGKRTRLTFALADSGIGMSKQDIARLFKPFAQASAEVSRRFGGAGLGLVFVKRLAKAMGGDLAVTSAPGRGSTFRLSVLVEPVAAPVPAESKPVATRSLKILCAEDNPYGRVVMNTILTELGHRADFVNSGEDAVAAVARGYDLVLMDVALPGIDGLEAARRIRALPGAARRTPVVGISGRGEASDEASARAAGMDFYLRKPVSPSAVSAAIAAVGAPNKGAVAD